MAHRFNPDIHHRRSTRRRGFDYASPGVYFVTCVVRCRLCLLGEINEQGHELNAAGEMIARQWRDLENRFSFCQPRDFVVMPNHFHGLLRFHTDSNWEPSEPSASDESPRGTLEDSLGRVMQAFKSCSTDDYIEGVHQHDWPRFERKLWLRNYWDRVVRNEDEWGRALSYIENNPIYWLEDKHHPETNLLLRESRDAAIP